jgi:hypothetical protein
VLNATQVDLVPVLSETAFSIIVHAGFGWNREKNGHDPVQGVRDGRRTAPVLFQKSRGPDASWGDVVQAVRELAEVVMQKLLDLTGMLRYLPQRRRRERRARAVLLGVINEAMARQQAGTKGSAPLLEVMLEANREHVWTAQEFLGQSLTCTSGMAPFACSGP